jgi:hypothetical protein
MRSVFGLLAVVAATPECPVSVPGPEDNGGIDAAAYVEELLSLLVYNGTHPGGKMTALEVFKPELTCYFGILLDQGCDGLPANEERGPDWESICLDPDKEYFDAYKMLSDDEVKAYNELVYSTMSSNFSEGLSVYDTLHNLTSPADGESKEVMCILTKLVDDGCLAFDSVRLSGELELINHQYPPSPIPDEHGNVLLQHGDEAPKPKAVSAPAKEAPASKEEKEVRPATPHVHRHHWNPYKPKGQRNRLRHHR